MSLKRTILFFFPMIFAAFSAHSQIILASNGGQTIVVNELPGTANNHYEEKNKKIFLNSLKLLTEEFQKSRELKVSCDKDGIYWAIIGESGGAVFNSKTKKVIYRDGPGGGVLFISPLGNYLVVFYGGTDGDSPPDEMGLKSLPSLKTVFGKKEDFYFVHFVGKDESSALVLKHHRQTGVIDLKSSAIHFVPKKEDDVP